MGEDEKVYTDDFLDRLCQKWKMSEEALDPLENNFSV